MNFDEAARTFQMTPPPANNFMPASFDLHYNMNLSAKHSPKLSLHSRSNTISDDSFGLKLHAGRINIKKEHMHDEIKTPETNMSHSDTYDDEMDTETDDDYLSAEADDDELQEDEIAKSKTRKVKSKTRLRSRTLSRPVSTNTNFLRIPNESDDNFDDFISDDRLDANLSLPPIMSNKLHIRSYSESNIQKSIQNNQWPSSASDDSFDFETRSNADSTVYSRYVSMKKKYKKQRRISQQFQEAITVIQDDNEDVMQMNEDQIRDHFEKEYEMKLIELEHEKLNTTINIEDKMKQVMRRNDELMMQNQQLQQQVVAQVGMIQEQQQIALQQQRQFVAMQSGNRSPSNSNMSPFTVNNTLQQQQEYPSTEPLLREASSASSALNKNLGLTPMSSNGESYTLNDDIASVATDLMYDNYDYNNMEPANKYKSIKKYHISKRKRLRDVDKKVCQTDEEMALKMRAAQSPWNRFLDLMTPSFCSCSPNVPQTKSII